MEKSHPGSVIFHSPSELQVSVLVSGLWKKPLTEVLIESEAAGGFGNMVDDACSGFVRWCFTQAEQPADFLSISSLPGIPFKNTEFDPWLWYDAVMSELAGLDDSPVLVDVDRFQIAHRGEVLWPPFECRRLLRPDRCLNLPEAPFPIGWFGSSDLLGLRERFGTYTCYGPDELPPIREKMDGSYGWLRMAITNRPMAEEKIIAADLNNLKALHTAILPGEFARFFREPKLWSKIRSTTDCYFHLAPKAVAIPGNLGLLIRFMSDSQGCKHWHLHLWPCGTKHSVVATYFFTGIDSNVCLGGKPHPRDTITCASSFEEFIYRFWLENEISFASYEESDMPAGAGDYLEFYRSKTSERESVRCDSKK